MLKPTGFHYCILVTPHWVAPMGRLKKKTKKKLVLREKNPQTKKTQLILGSMGFLSIRALLQASSRAKHILSYRESGLNNNYVVCSLGMNLLLQELPKPTMSYSVHYRTPIWRRAWQPTPVFLPGESHGQRSLTGYSPWHCKKSDTTEARACLFAKNKCLRSFCKGGENFLRNVPKSVFGLYTKTYQAPGF